MRTIDRPGCRPHPEPRDGSGAIPATGCKFALFTDPLLEDAPLPGSAFFEVIVNDDATVSLQTLSGQYVRQEPNTYGLFGLAETIGPYERYGLLGNLITSWTRPTWGDRIYTYVLVALPNAAEPPATQG